MSSPHCTPSPPKVLLAKTVDAHQCMEAEWCLISEGELDPVSSDNEYTKQEEAEKRAWEEAECLAHEEAAKKVEEEAERKVEEECKVQEEVVRAKEEAERRAREDAEREDVMQRAAQAAEERADTERRALEERLWETVVAPLWVAKPSGRMAMVGSSTPGQRASGVQDPCTRCHNKGTSCILSTAKGKITKRKWVQQSEEAEDMEIVEVGEDDEEEEVQSHFAVLTHLMEEHWDALGVIEAIADELWRLNDLKEEEMGKSKGKGKEKAQEEFRRARMEDDDGDMEMGGVGPLSLA
ncbi:hypothetical protein ID866_12125 [Astraeus odoratus]|nr:hypothetical protein ID866_12125 [Astraeus odoratus]